MTKSEAQAKLDEQLTMENERSNRECFCPDIHRFCRLDCILFVKSTGEIAYKHGDKQNGWEINVHHGYCRRHMK